jgi:glutaredoxin-related protein
MEIADGGTVSAEYLRVTFGDFDTLDRQNVRDKLAKYCGLDTMGMVWIVDKLSELLQT